MVIKSFAHKRIEIVNSISDGFNVTALCPGQGYILRKRSL
jgi:hypothetical protein